ncbi:MAG: DUF2975 domain-containing protein [Opitutaceae bacterium]|nr:DUF2975 domain-containing protein [Opitutaceae bacterium]
MSPTLNRSTALFLQAALVLTGIGILALMLWEPHLEGRNAQATVFEIYFKDPFLAYVYVGSIPFFVALYRAFGLFGHTGRHGAFSPVTVEALRAIRRCMLVFIGFVAGGLVFVVVFGDKEDRPAGVFMGGLIFLAASGTAIAATMCARKLQETLGHSAGRQG